MESDQMNFGVILEFHEIKGSKATVIAKTTLNGDVLCVFDPKVVCNGDNLVLDRLLQYKRITEDNDE